MSFSIGFSCIVIGVLIIVWGRYIHNHRKSVDGVREEFARAEESNHQVTERLDDATDTCTRLEETTGRIQEGITELGETVTENENIFDQIRKQKIK